MSDPSFWGNPAVNFTAPCNLEVDFASNGDDFSAIFPSASLNFNPGSGPTSLALSLSFSAPVILGPGRQLVGYRQALNYGVTKSPGMRVLIVTDFAGTMDRVEFNFETPAASGAPAELASVILAPRLTFSAQGLEVGDGHGLLAPAADYAATITVTIQRRNLDEFGLVQINGLDVKPTILPAPAPQD